MDTTTNSETDKHELDSPESAATRPALRRSVDGRMLAGVAAGLAGYLDADTTLVRIGIVALTLMGGAAVPLYLAAWLLIPDEGSDESLASELLGRAR